ncbi:hypothetical protein VTO58DRAFT_109456 [Aureobasidium pullulans]
MTSRVTPQRIVQQYCQLYPNRTNPRVVIRQRKSGWNLTVYYDGGEEELYGDESSSANPTPTTTTPPSASNASATPGPSGSNTTTTKTSSS